MSGDRTCVAAKGRSIYLVDQPRLQHHGDTSWKFESTVYQLQWDFIFEKIKCSMGRELYRLKERPKQKGEG